MLEEYLWVEKYRPKTIEETILPTELKEIFQGFVNDKNVPSLLLCGSSGVGKTTVARAMLEELGADYIIKNGSLNTSMDVLRNEITTFASSVSFSGGRKYVIIDEADGLNATVQPALRNFIEEYSANCGFILTANFKNRIIAPLRSRCSVIDFKFPKKMTPELAMQFYKRVTAILKENGVEFDKTTVAELIQKHFPDYRRVLNELQAYASRGSIDAGILAKQTDASIAELLSLMKAKNYSAVRKWVGENVDKDTDALLRTFYDQGASLFEPSFIPALVILIAKYQYQSAFAVDHEINISAFLAEVMIEVGSDWRK